MKPTAHKKTVSKVANQNLLLAIRELILSARNAVIHQIDIAQVLTNFEVGKRIVEHEQGGEDRAKYGEKVLVELSEHLTAEFGTGFSLTNLKLMRQFYLTYRNPISQTLSGQFQSIQKGQTPSDQSLQNKDERAPDYACRLSWSHYVFLMGLKDADVRRFYEIESVEQSWTLRELKRQFNSGLYERLALSRNKTAIRRLAQEGQLISKPEDLIKNPYVLEFLGLDEKAAYSETELEKATIDKMEHFLLELGKGFLFEARQKRFTFDEDHFFVDLVFYNRLLRCYVLIDLKIGKLTHQDLGQMQMYVNYFDRFVKTKEENPTVGIILCQKKKDSLVEITLPKDANIHASEYLLYLPSKEVLKKKLLDWSAEQGVGK